MIADIKDSLKHYSALQSRPPYGHEYLGMPLGISKAAEIIQSVRTALENGKRVRGKPQA